MAFQAVDLGLSRPSLCNVSANQGFSDQGKVMGVRLEFDTSRWCRQNPDSLIGAINS